MYHKRMSNDKPPYVIRLSVKERVRAVYLYCLPNGGEQGWTSYLPFVLRFKTRDEAVEFAMLNLKDLDGVSVVRLRKRATAKAPRFEPVKAAPMPPTVAPQPSIVSPAPVVPWPGLPHVTTPAHPRPGEVTAPWLPDRYTYEVTCEAKEPSH